jgi:hypothetical protein
MRAKTINEVQKFERGQSPKDSLNIGLWKELDEENQMKISLEDFFKNGGKLTIGREIWLINDANIWPNGFYVGEDEEGILITQEDLMGGFNPKFKKSRSLNQYDDYEDYGVKVPTKIMYN